MLRTIGKLSSRWSKKQQLGLYVCARHAVGDADIGAKGAPLGPPLGLGRSLIGILQLLLEKLCMNMYVDMCVGVCVDMCVDKCVDMCVGVCTDMCVDKWIDMCVDMGIDLPCSSS